MKAALIIPFIIVGGVLQADGGAINGPAWQSPGIDDQAGWTVVALRTCLTKLPPWREPFSAGPASRTGVETVAGLVPVRQPAKVHAALRAVIAESIW